jgi:NADH-quinone oxidoreductase subunit F
MDKPAPDWLAALSPTYRFRIHVCFGKNCTPGGSHEVFDTFREEIRKAGLTAEVELIASSCRSRCELGPSVNVYPGPIIYGWMTPEGVRRIVREHLIGGTPVSELEIKPGQE